MPRNFPRNLSDTPEKLPNQLIAAGKGEAIICVASTTAALAGKSGEVFAFVGTPLKVPGPGQSVSNW